MQSSSRTNAASGSVRASQSSRPLSASQLALRTRAAAAIDAALACGLSFALYREPGTLPELVLQAESSCSVFADPSELHGAGFVLAPFAATPSCPGVIIAPDVRATGLAAICDALESMLPEPLLNAARSAEPEIPSSDFSEISFPEEPVAPYREAFSKFHDRLCRGGIQKLVLSRSQELPISCSAGRTFLQACDRYSDALPNLVSTRISGTWLGATPEILLSGSASRWKTMALAGTMPADSTAPWDMKNQKEQAIVADYIRGRLSPLAENIREKGPFTSRAGALRHLRTDFVFAPKGNDAPSAILASLHPTPAVCGLPKEEARAFILENEGTDRRYYSGFLGWWEDGAAASLYVNLRCMELLPGRIRLHAGGGILPASNAGSEWTESCQKMRTMLSLLESGKETR